MQLASGNETSTKAVADELDLFADATQALRSETGGLRDRRIHFFFLNSDSSVPTTVDLGGFAMVCDASCPCIFVAMKFVTSSRVNHLINGMLPQASSSVSRNSWYDAETAYATVKTEDL